MCDSDACAVPLPTRRQLLTGAAAGLGLMATWRAGNAFAAMDDIRLPASAVEPATRLEIPPEIPPPPTTVPFEPPGPGQILFPLALGTEWTAYVLDNFGDTRGRTDGYYHQGVDIMADQNTPQVAVVGGILTIRHTSNLYGWTLTGDDGVSYRYFHNTPDDAGWSQGDRVEQGDIIGYVGDSGTSAGNYHLHFEYRPNNVPADSFHKLTRISGATFQP